MKAVVVTEPNRFSIEDVADPEPGAFEVKCQVRAVTICGTDSHLLRGDYPEFWPPGFPFIPGHEWAGEIVEVGPGAELLGWKTGDRVAGTSHDACGYCQKCVEGRYNLCENYGVPGLHHQYGHNYQGAFAEFVVHGAKAVFPLPDELSFDEGALLDPASIALHTANRGGNRPGDTVVVFGPGPIGLLAADCARSRGAGKVIVVGRGSRLAKAAQMGSDVVDYTSEDPVAAIRQATAGLGTDVVLECAGVPQTYQWSLEVLRKGGRVASVGIPVEDVKLSLQELVLYEFELVGARASAGEMVNVTPLVVEGHIRVGELITHHFPLVDFAEAIDTFNERRDGALKIILQP